MVTICSAKNHKIIEIKKKVTQEKLAHFFAISFASFIFPAPKCCQTTIHVAIPNHIAVNKTICVTLNDAQYAAAATIQNVFIILSNSIIDTLRADCSNEEGIHISIDFVIIFLSGLKSDKVIFTQWFHFINR